MRGLSFDTCTCVHAHPPHEWHDTNMLFAVLVYERQASNTAVVSGPPKNTLLMTSCGMQLSEPLRPLLNRSHRASFRVDQTGIIQWPGSMISNWKPADQQLKARNECILGDVSSDEGLLQEGLRLEVMMGRFK
jgi:hypothetical protein